MINAQHLLKGARWQASSNCDARPEGAFPELIVVHCVSLPEGEFGSGLPAALFCNALNCDAHPSFEDLRGLHVSPHLMIDRGGAIDQFVTFDQRAWHAGISSWQGRRQCNDFSIGIELEGTPEMPFTEPQYQTLITVCGDLLQRYPSLSANAIVGHLEIAPGRKQDPGGGFDWPRVLTRVFSRQQTNTAATG